MTRSAIIIITTATTAVTTPIAKAITTAIRQKQITRSRMIETSIIAAPTL